MAERAWLLTWTTYGTWLPGDQRGFVGFIRETNNAAKADDAVVGFHPVE